MQSNQDSEPTSRSHDATLYSRLTTKTELQVGSLEVDLLSVTDSLCAEDLEATLRKLSIFPASFLTTIVSILLIVCVKDGWYIDGSSYAWIARNRASAQIIVQVLAGLLGFAQFSTFRSLVNYSARRRLARRSMTLDGLNFCNSLVTSQINWSLPPASLLGVLITALVALAPAAIWAGALTPIIVPHAKSLNYTIPVPAYTSRTERYWNASWYDTEPTQTALGTFTYGAIRNRHGFLINDGSQASSVDRGPVIMRKGDNSKYTYRGRSYGVGASVGINDTEFASSPQLLNYTYSENGYRCSWTCEYNRTSASRLELMSTEPVNIYIARGSSPISGDLDDGYLVADLSGHDLIVASKSFFNDWNAWRANYSAPNSYIVIMAAGSEYEDLKNIQCEGTTVPTLFQVAVDTVSRVITVVPNSTAHAENIDSTGFIANKAGDTLAALSLVSTTSFTSELGDMLKSNIFNVNQSGLEDTKEATYTRGVGESLQALSDQQLFSTAGAQLVIARDASHRPVVVQTQVMRVGQDFYIYASAALNAVLVLAMLFEAIRTRHWQGMPRLNFADVKSAVVASSGGGTGIARAVKRKHEHARDNEDYSYWVGDATDRKAGTVEVILGRGLAGPALSISSCG